MVTQNSNLAVEYISVLFEENVIGFVADERLEFTA